MQKFTPVAKPFEGDFYQIFDLDGTRYIHVFGYIYQGDLWQNNEVSHFLFPLKEFCQNFRSRGWDFIDECYDGLTQYVGEYPTEEDCLRDINGYFDGRPADAYLWFNEVTEDTPCGNYIDTGR